MQTFATLVLALGWLAQGGPAAAQDGGAGGPPAPPAQDGELDQLGRELRGDGPWRPAEGPKAPYEPYRTPVRPLEAPTSPWSLESRLRLEQQGGADLGGSPGRLETRRIGVDVGASRGDRNGGFLGGLSVEFSEYRFRDATGILPNTDSPTEDLYSLALSAGWRQRWSERWAWLASASARAAGEHRAELQDGLTYSGLGTLTYEIERGLGLTFGAMVSTELEDSTQVVPLIGLDWRIDARTEITTRGPRVELSRELDGGFRTFAAIEYQSRQYRLDDQGPLPEGALRDRIFAATLGLEWNPEIGAKAFANSRLRVFAGSNLWREISFLDDDDTVARSRMHPGPVFGVSLRTTF